MAYKAQLGFLQQLLEDLHISSCILDNASQSIPGSIDFGLRADLFGLEDYAHFLQNPISEAKDNTVYCFCDEYGCKYIFLRLPDEKDRYFFIGPYLLEFPTKEWMDRKADSMQLADEQRRSMQLYYGRLPLIEDENLLLTMSNTLAKNLWGTAENFAMEYVDYAIPDRYEPVPYQAADRHLNDASLSLSALESNYENENLLMDAVSKGKLHLVTAVASTVFTNGTQQRLSDSLRDRRNYLIILKTLLRKAAEYGGVHPLHIHRLSSHFAAEIERVRSIKESLGLQEEMIRSFCQLVKQHSLSRFSCYVGQTITMVQYDLTADLRLNAIAERLNVNPSYLSNLFHKEYGCTLTSFINKQRVDKGIALLRMSNKPVQEIAAECGVQDVNYFIKLFKKQTGFTPNRYREMTVSNKQPTEQ